MPIQLVRNNRFVQVRVQIGAIVNDTTPPTPISAPDAAAGASPASTRTDSDGSPLILAYWTATGETGTVTLQLWILSPTDGKFVLVDSATSVAPNAVVPLKAHGASSFYIAFAATSGASGSSSAEIYAMASTSVSV